MEQLTVQDDGRVTVNVDSKISQVFARLMDTSDIDEPADAPPPTYTETGPWSLYLNIVIMVVGSRGDVQPFIALGNGLQEHGHRVRIATHAIFKDLVQSAGLEFYSIGGDPAQLMAYMVKNPGLTPKMKTIREGEIRAKRRMVHEMVRRCWAACVEPDESGIPFVANAIISNPPTFAHIHCAQALGIPLHMVFTMPWSPTKAFPHPLANVRNTTTDGKTANRLSFSLVNALTWQGLGDIINKFRAENLGLEEVPMTEGPFLAETLKIPHTYCWSPALISKPHDWREHLDVTEFILGSPPLYNPPPELDNFLKSGPPPLYVGFGSIVVEKPHLLLEIVLKAVEISNVRCIISKGWSSLSTEDIPENVIFVGECPHAWLFQHTFAVVHHGGAGTTAAGLNAGKPTVVVPFFGDQPFWGDMVAKSGAGPQPLPHSGLNAEDLAAAIDFCKSPEVDAAAKAVAVKMQSENGVEAAVASFHRHLRPETLRCDLIPTLPAVFECTKGTTFHTKRAEPETKVVKLSGLAAETLEKAGKIKLKGLRAYKPNTFTIENRRWDFASSFSSAALGLSYELLSTTNEFWYAPYKLHERKDKSTSSAASFVSDQEAGSEVAESSSRTTKSEYALSTAKYVGASAGTIPKLLGVMTKGVCVDLPVAVTEGLRATPKLHGETVKNHEPITDWKSGLRVAGKDCAIGVGTGLADMFVQPYIGARKHGVRGFATGIAKGAMGTATKTGSAVMGLYAHPAQGIWRSIHTASHSSTEKGIMSARRIHNIYFARSEASQASDAAIIEAFDNF